MSAKRRQDAIERFSIPLEDNEIGALSDDPEPVTRSRGRATTIAARNVEYDDADTDDSDEDFEDDDHSPTSSTHKRKGKGKNCSSNNSLCGDNPKVMLLSLKCGSLGLNLTVANNVYL
jgi:SWI/SNF-related matrix-associated actin-dependent regulator of chromatin subfamily A3